MIPNPSFLQQPHHQRLELIGSRWWRSLSVIKAVLRKEATCPPPLFMHADILDCSTLSPFTHVYTFDRGFPPHTLRHMFHMFNEAPESTTLICYQQPRKCYELGLQSTTRMVQRFPMKMCGSGEQHSCFVYVKEAVLLAPPSASAASSSASATILWQNTTPCGRGPEVLNSEWVVPGVPTGSADVDSPVRHGASYHLKGDVSGLRLATNAMQTTNTLHAKRQLHRLKYEAWVEDQLGLNSSERCQRKSRTTRINYTQ